MHPRSSCLVTPGLLYHHGKFSWIEPFHCLNRIYANNAFILLFGPLQIPSPFRDGRQFLIEPLSLDLSCHNNVGLKTRACQSSNGRVLSLNRQADIGPHLAPQVHPKSSFSYRNKFSSSAMISMKKEPTSASLPCVIRMSEGY